MSQDFVVKLAENAVYTILIVSAPMLGFGLLIGLLVSIFQATTQIQEQTLAFIPKIIAVLISLVVFGPWILNKLLDFTYGLFNNMNQFIG
ncbi:flagellar biosynthesis protein FliQ [Microaerobacter geothermalis]|uniref:flagellar biosynthesis protein FliQ n=1 Tax=Microaerobacter geothermalis TaxID=674972 RepID=UPI001F3DDBCD|nr:flagellar biosynthesis protein FliQ [Microaerobacter geothermalis]MCF6093823.1 flagellar biosynthesis protein FliQ [Microaerobacter geothermalis]